MQRISTRLDALARLGDFEAKTKYDDWRSEQDASDRVWAAFRIAFPTEPMSRMLSADGKSYVLGAAPPGSPSFEKGLEAFCDRVAADTATDADRELMAALVDDFHIIGINGLEYMTALARVLREF